MKFLLQVTQLPYPVKAKPLGKFRYYEKREEWKVTDVLFNPMVMMMVMPLLLITVLPKMMQDPETKKEMEEMQVYQIQEIYMFLFLKVYFTLPYSRPR